MAEDAVRGALVSRPAVAICPTWAQVADGVDLDRVIAGARRLA